MPVPSPQALLHALLAERGGGREAWHRVGRHVGVHELEGLVRRAHAAAPLLHETLCALEQRAPPEGSAVRVRVRVRVRVKVRVRSRRAACPLVDCDAWRKWDRR